MSTITRYVLTQFLAIFLVALVVMTLLMILIGLVREGREQGLGLVQIAQLIPYVLPDALRFAVPATVLFAVSLVYGRMSSSNEIVALKSLGISPWVILFPMLVSVALISLVSVWLADVAAGWGREGIKRVIIGSVEEIAYGHLRTQKSYSSRRFSITVKRVDQRRLIEPIVTFQADDSMPSLVIRAEWAELHADPAHDTLTILLHNGSASGGGVNVDFPGTERRVLPLSDNEKRSLTWAPTEMPMRAIPAAISTQKERIEDVRERLAARAAFTMLRGEIDDLAPSQWLRANEQLQAFEQQLHRLETEPCRRWAGGFSCLCFALIGAPLAIRMRNADFLTSFFLCFLPILLVYYPLLQYSIDRAKLGSWPSESVWLGNIVLAVWGFWLIRRVLRY